MSTRRYAFKLNDTTRLIKSVIAAGLPSERLRVIHDILGHRISVEVRDADTEATEDDLQKLV
jgi:hypothetical protein